jgi:hypothetical protein
MKINKLFMLVILFGINISSYSQSISCGSDISSVVKSKNLSEGEHEVCITSDGKKIIAIVKESQVVDLILKDAKNNTITTGNKVYSKAKKKGGAKKDTIDSVFPVEITICDKDKDGKPINCTTYKRY